MESSTSKVAHLGELLHLRKALEMRDVQAVARLIEETADIEGLGNAIRYGLTHYRTEMPVGDNTKNSIIWAIPVVLQQGSDRFISTNGNLQKVFTSASRQLVRKMIGAQYEVVAYDGLVHSDMLAGMGVTTQLDFFGRLVGLDQGKDVPSLKLSSCLSKRIQDGKQPELCFMVGSATRFNTQPSIGESWYMSDIDFQQTLKGHIAVHAEKSFLDLFEISCGMPRKLEDALVEGYFMLINGLASRYKTFKPNFTVHDACTYKLNVPLINDDGLPFVREICMKTSNMSLDAMAEVYEYACSRFTGEGVTINKEYETLH